MAGAMLGWHTVGVLLVLRPLATVFSCAELLLFVLLALALDRCGVMCSSDSDNNNMAAAHSAKPTPVSRIIEKTQAAMTGECDHKTATSATAVAATKRTRSDLVGVSPAVVAARQCTTSRGAPKRKASGREHDEVRWCTARDDFDYDSVDSCSTSDTADMASQSTPHAMQFDARERLSEPACSETLPFQSLAMSRCSSEFALSVEFLHKSGELLMRRDSVFHVIKPWRKCSVLLSVATGELFVHRKSSAPPQVLPLSRFTGASIHPKRRHSFKVMFDGHAPLHFRVAKAQDVEHWIQALEYAKEATWRLWE